MHQVKILAMVLLLGVLLAHAQQPKPAVLTETEKKALAQVRQLGGLASEIAQNDNRVEVSYRQNDGKFSEQHLLPLKDLKTLVHLNLGGRPVTDAQLVHLKDLTSLVELHLENS